MIEVECRHDGKQEEKRKLCPLNLDEDVDFRIKPTKEIVTTKGCRRWKTYGTELDSNNKWQVWVKNGCSAVFCLY